MKIYVGNLSFEAGEKDLRDAFAAFGQVESASVIKDSYSGRSRGFGFVEMPVESEARAAISELNGKEMKGRTIKVNQALDRPEGRRGGGGRDRGRPQGGDRGDRGDRGGRGRGSY